jgi:hypothetical protein
MRRPAFALLAVMLLAGCTATAIPRPGTGARETPPAPRRCSPADPGRWAWFCVVGQVLYGAASFVSPVDGPRMR